MKVVFLQDVPNMGKAGQIKEVADGYGRNYLIPKKLAAPAVAASIRKVEAQMASQAHKEAKTEAEMVELASQLNGREIFIKAKSGGKEKLYGSVTAADIAVELEKLTEMAIDKRKIKLDEPINQTGSYEVAIRLSKDIIPKVKVTVTGKSE